MQELSKFPHYSLHALFPEALIVEHELSLPEFFAFSLAENSHTHELHCHRSSRGRLDALCSRWCERRLYLVGSGRELVLAKSFRI